MARPGLILIAGFALVAIARNSPADAQETRVLITKADCSRLVKYTASPDVAYQQGIDAHGQTVVPAGMNSQPRFQADSHYLVSLEVDLAERLGIPPGPSYFDADAEIGLVEVREDRTFLNGRPLQSEGQAELAALCRQAESRTPKEQAD
jgi:hypothetical protein